MPHLSQQQLERCRAFSIGFALLAFCIGGAALFGWILDNDFLKRVHPSLVTMKANTAVCLMLLGVAVVRTQNRSAATSSRRIAQVFAVIVGLIGLITLSEHIFGWNTGLDQLLFHESHLEAGQLAKEKSEIGPAGTDVDYDVSAGPVC